MTDKCIICGVDEQGFAGSGTCSIKCCDALNVMSPSEQHLELDKMAGDWFAEIEYYSLPFYLKIWWLVKRTLKRIARVGNGQIHKPQRIIHGASEMPMWERIYSCAGAYI